MMNYESYPDCIECDNEIHQTVSYYSLKSFGHPLCRNCQEWFKEILIFTTATDYAIELYFALKRRGVPATLEKCDGFKTIDIAVPEAKVNIEVDGGHHNYNAKQALSDLQRILHSHKKGYSTLHIPNSLAKYNLEDAADLITEYLNVSNAKKRRR